MKNTKTTRKIAAMLAAVMMMTTTAAIGASADSSEAFAANKTTITAAQAETVFKFDGTRYTSVTANVLNKQIKSQYFDKAEMMKFVDNIRQTGDGKKSIADYLRENGQKLPEESYTGYAPHVDHRYILVDTKITTTKKYNRTESDCTGVGHFAHYYSLYYYDMTETVKAIDIYDPECKVQDIVIRTYERVEDSDGGDPETKNIKNKTVAFLTIDTRAATKNDNIGTRKPVNENVQDTKGPKLDIKGPKLVFSDYKPVIKGPIVK